MERKEIWWIYCYCQPSTPSYTTYWISFVINRFGFYFSNLFLTFPFNSIICPYSLENKLLLRDAELMWLQVDCGCGLAATTTAFESEWQNDNDWLNCLHASVYQFGWSLFYFSLLIPTRTQLIRWNWMEITVYVLEITGESFKLP